MIRSQRGQTTAEYMGVLLLVAVIIGALITTGLGGKIAGGAGNAICKIAGGCDSPKVTSERASGQPPASDRDGDGVSNARERELGSNPDDTDSDADGLPDGEEQRVGGDPNRADSDDDGLPDAQEAGAGLNLREGDTDKDGLSDAEELAAGTDPTEADGDGEHGSTNDGLTDKQEIDLGTDPNAYDTDGDGYPDGYEVRHGTDPVEDERSVPQKLFEDVVLDDPIGFAIPGGAGAKGARKVVDGLISVGGKAARRLGSAKTIGELAQIRRERIRVLRDRLRSKLKREPSAKPVAPAKRGSGKTVLGRYPRYVKLSDKLNARRFQIPDDVWERMTPAEQWAANQRFLDRTIARRDEIILATPINDKVPVTSSYFKELQYMKSKGYRVSPGGRKLLPPK